MAGIFSSSKSSSGGLFSSGTKKEDLNTSAGLFKYAQQSGLGTKADAIKAKSMGEKPKQIYSGGFISDAFDTLSILQYGTVGLLKGKSFSEGVKTRASFTDQDALGGKGIPAMIAGIALDIAFDPLTYIAPATVVKKVPFLSKLLKGTKEAAFGRLVEKTIQTSDEGEKAYQAIEGGTKLGKYLGQKFVWMFGADPVYKEAFKRSTLSIGKEAENLANLTKAVDKLDPKTAAKILTRDKTGRFQRTKLDKLDLTPDELEPVGQLYKILDDLGQEAVDLGILSKAKFEENFGVYLKNAYEEYEKMAGKKLFPSSRVGIKGIKARKDVENISEFDLTQVDNPAYLLFKSAFDLKKDVENAKLLKLTATNFGTDIAQDGFVQVAKAPKWGALSGKYVPENIKMYLDEMIEPSTQNALTKSIVGNFKFAKVILNPATHARNVASNATLNWWKLGLGPWRADIYAEALKQTRYGGKWADEAREVGWSLNSGAASEISNLLESAGKQAWGNKAVQTVDTVKTKLASFYQREEDVAKMAAFIHQRKKGLSIEDAWNAAESATFNYAQVTPFVRKLRESIWGVPFITFTVKATPVALETAYKNPKRITAFNKFKQALESNGDPEETARERASEPPWVKNGFYVKLPWKSKQKLADGTESERSAYLDLTYILPFGDLVSGQWLEGGIGRETGLPENKLVGALSKAPLFNFLKEIQSNQDFYGDKIWKDSASDAEKIKDLTRHITKTFAPPPISDNLKGGYDKFTGERNVRGLRGALSPEEKANQDRNLMEEMMKLVGAKVQPINADIQEQYQEWNQKKALQTLLTEEADMKTLNIPYIPKD